MKPRDFNTEDAEGTEGAEQTLCGGAYAGLVAPPLAARIDPS